MAEAATLRIERRLTPAQAERWERLRAAAGALAAEGGYEAVTMQAVAARAGVSRATVYRYFATRDHLMAEVVVAWGREIADELRATPRQGGPAARVAAALTEVIEHARRRPALSRAAVTSALSADPEAVRAQARFAGLIRDYLEAALGPEAPPPGGEEEALLGHLFFSILVQVTTGRMPPPEAAHTLEAAARRLLPGDPR